jgi:hypothetical protein
MEKRGFLFQDYFTITYEFTIVLNSIFLMVSIIVLIPALILLAKIYKLTKFSDIPMICSISATSLSLIFLIGSLIAIILDEVFKM